MAVVIWLAIATVSISYTLTKTPVFDFVRDRLHEDGMLFKLWSCPYCMSHWIAFGFTAAFRPEPLTGTWIDLFPVAFIMVTLSGLVIQTIVVMSKLASLLSRVTDNQ